MQSNLKFTIHCNDMVRNILKTFKNQDCIFYLKLFTIYVRPVLEYASQVWFPPLTKISTKLKVFKGICRYLGKNKCV